MDFETALPYLICAYVGIWLAVLVYLVAVQRNIRGLFAKADSLGKAIEKRNTARTPEPSGHEPSLV